MADPTGDPVPDPMTTGRDADVAGNAAADADADVALRHAIAAALREAGHDAPTVRVTGEASLGANRRTCFIDIDAGGRTRAAVVQVPAGAMSHGSFVAEARLLAAAAAAGVPVPSPLASSDGGADGRTVGAAPALLVTDRIDGQTIPRRILRATAQRPALGAALTVDLGRALARLGRVDTQALPASLPRLDAADPAADYVATLERQLAALEGPLPSMRAGLAWLRRHRPAPPPRPGLVHGDFRNGNLIVGTDGLAAILDWELAHVGDPMEDAAYLCMRWWRFGSDALPVGGFGRVATLRAAFEADGGVWRSDAFRWWMTARTVWWGIGLARQAQAFGAGQSRSIVLAASGRRVVELEYDLLNLIGDD